MSTQDSSTAAALPFAAGETLLTGCGRRAPCAAELWRAESGEEAVALLAGETLLWGETAWPAAWKRIGTELSFCLTGGPLASPPAGDPGGFRLLSATSPPQEDPEAMWLLHLTGENTCQLSGELLLSATRDRADSRGLLSGGKPWSEGGREHALEVLKFLHAEEGGEAGSAP